MMIVKVPGINGLGKTNGCKYAGEAIINELKNIWSNEKGKIINKEVLDLKEIHVNDENLEEQEKLIYENAREAFENQDKVIFLGGDHSISRSIGTAFLKYCMEMEKEPCLIIFDAHPDCMPFIKSPSHEEWLRDLIEKEFPVEDILLVGVRNSDQEEIRFLAEKKIKQISINQLNENLQDMTDTIMEFAFGKELYVSLDIDVVDPAFASSTGYLEPGGLTSRQIIYVMQRVALIKNLKAIDIVEVNSEDDRQGMTVKLASKILAEII